MFLGFTGDGERGYGVSVFDVMLPCIIILLCIAS